MIEKKIAKDTGWISAHPSQYDMGQPGREEKKKNHRQRPWMHERVYLLGSIEGEVSRGRKRGTMCINGCKAGRYRCKRDCQNGA